MSLQENQRAAYRTAISNGLSAQGAKVLTANATGESLANPANHHWDISHYSEGIAQWETKRAERIKNHFGKYPRQMTVGEQIVALLWECRLYYPKTYAALYNNHLSPFQQINMIVRDFERPANPFAAVKARMHFYNNLHVG